ncbi:MAG: RNHCP domain-containing protein [Alphaproteobacteria bacterium]|nr:RNHCP domain-containing protein [Alphaproteobacteria bacterium]
MVKNFARTIEDFTCDVCGAFVKGNGYTNHCPHCLSSKHVDINPGDRAATCQGTMYAVALEFKGSEQYIVHKCVLCGHTRRNKVSPNDNFNAVLAVSNGTIEQYIDKLKRRPK